MGIVFTFGGSSFETKKKKKKKEHSQVKHLRQYLL